MTDSDEMERLFAVVALAYLIPTSLKAHPCSRRARSALGRGRNGRWRTGAPVRACVN